MGTSYLYTSEAVGTGAIRDQFQNRPWCLTVRYCWKQHRIMGLECLNSPFAAFFNEEKEELQKAGVIDKEIWAKLGRFNVGRLRIAAKGIERRGDELVTIDEERTAGTGCVHDRAGGSMRNKIVSVLDLHKGGC